MGSVTQDRRGAAAIRVQQLERDIAAITKAIIDTRQRADERLDAALLEPVSKERVLSYGGAMYTLGDLKQEKHRYELELGALCALHYL
jgi:hypothetical protein